MFEAYFKSPDVFKNVLDAIKDLLDDATFECNGSGIELQSMDKAHVSLVLLTLAAGGFQKYRHDRDLVMRMNLASVAKIFKYANNKEMLTMTAKDDPDTVKFQFETPKQEQVRQYEIKLMTLDDRDILGIHPLNYACNVCMPSAQFTRICRDLEQFGETMVISCTPGVVKFSASGDEGEANVNIAQNLAVDKPEDAITIDADEAVTMKFSLKYLKLFTKAAPLSAQVQLSMSADTPLMVEYGIPDYGYIRYYLAGLHDDEE